MASADRHLKGLLGFKRLQAKPPVRSLGLGSQSTAMPCQPRPLGSGWVDLGSLGWSMLAAPRPQKTQMPSLNPFKPLPLQIKTSLRGPSAAWPPLLASPDHAPTYLINQNANRLRLCTFVFHLRCCARALAHCSRRTWTSSANAPSAASRAAPTSTLARGPVGPRVLGPMKSIHPNPAQLGSISATCPKARTNLRAH